jgi:hypothetical protein
MMNILKVLTLVTLSAMLMVACTKTVVKPTAASPKDTVYAYSPGISGPMGAAVPDSALVGSWTLVSDSTSLSGGESKAFDSGAKYTGHPGDYFNITSEGKITMNEGSNYQTINCMEINSANNSFELWYTQYPNVAIAGSGFIHAELLQPVVTANSAILTSQIIGTMGINTRQFVLKR